MTTNPQHKRANGQYLVDWFADAPHDSSNTLLFWAACRAFENGYNIIDDLAATAEQIGLPPAEIHLTINNARMKTKEAS